MGLGLSNFSDEELKMELHRRRVKPPPALLEPVDYQAITDRVIALVERMAAPGAMDEDVVADEERSLFALVMTAHYGEEEFWPWWNKRQEDGYDEENDDQ